jgi:alpha-tubulin suppressor-like RCC1 family protein
MVCWGSNIQGQLGPGLGNSTYFFATPQVVRESANQFAAPLSNIVAISAGGVHTCAIIEGGELKCWGYNGNGQVGNGTTSLNGVSPTQVQGLDSGITAVAAGLNHTCAINSDRDVLCWGRNDRRQLGAFHTNQSSVPILAVGGSGTAQAPGIDTGVIAITSGEYHSCALNENRRPLCWGNNSESQLGNNQDTAFDYPPIFMYNSSRISSVAAGGEITCTVYNPSNVNSPQSVDCFGCIEWIKTGNSHGSCARYLGIGAPMGNL